MVRVGTFEITKNKRSEKWAVNVSVKLSRTGKRYRKLFQRKVDAEKYRNGLLLNHSHPKHHSLRKLVGWHAQNGSLGRKQLTPIINHNLIELDNDFGLDWLPKWKKAGSFPNKSYNPITLQSAVGWGD